MLGYEMLLRAAFLDGRESLAAWNQWQSSSDLDRIDHTSYWLLPLVHRKLKALGVEHPYMDRLKGVRRQVWLKNQLTIRSGLEALHILKAAGIEAIVLRGAARIGGDFEDADLRPIRDCDFLVRDRVAVDAVRVLESAGWRRVTASPSKLTPLFRGFRSSIVFRNSAGVELRLHWHILSICCSTSADKEFWRRAEPAVVEGVETLTLAPTDQLLHACLSGPEWSYTSTAWWVADAMMILQRPDRIDAERILRFAREYRLVLPTRNALNYVHTTVAAPVPQDLLRGLAEQPVSRMDQLEFECLTKPYRERSLTAWTIGTYRRHKRRGTGTFIGHLAYSVRWGVLPHFTEKRLRAQNHDQNKA